MKEINKYGIYFWIGGGVYSLINMILNIQKINQSKILTYNYLIAGVAIVGLNMNSNYVEESQKKEQGMN